MKPSSTHWRHFWLCCLAICSSTGLGAGVASAQTDDGGWFDGSAPRAEEREAPPPAPAREPDYSPPPPDFQTPPAAPPAAEEEVVEDDPEAQRKAVEEFSPRLEPYGTWVDDSRYGRIWVPSRSIVGTEFVPYSTAGHWALTPDDDWIWVSDYPFGAVTFHYGRWVWTSGSYWGWVPGYVYAPAWVDFHVGAAGYIGWAPLAPRYGWRHGVFFSVGVWGPPPVVFCPTRYVFVRSMPHYVVRDRVRVRSMAAQTRVYRSPRYASGGPRYLARGPSPSELNVPRSALPERRVASRRLIAEPLPVSRSRATGRVQLSGESRYASRSEAPYRGREASPNAQLPARSRQYQTAPRGYSDQGRYGRPEPSRSYSDQGRYGRPQPQPRQELNGRRNEPRMLQPGPQRGSVWGSREGREPNRAAPRALPQRSGPAMMPRDQRRDHVQRSPYGGGAFNGAQGAVRGGNGPAVAPRAPRPAPDNRGNARRSRRGDDSSSGDSRSRGRERYGSGR